MFWKWNSLELRCEFFVILFGCMFFGVSFKFLIFVFIYFDRLCACCLIFVFIYFDRLCVCCLILCCFICFRFAVGSCIFFGIADSCLGLYIVMFFTCSFVCLCFLNFISGFWFVWCAAFSFWCLGFCLNNIYFIINSWYAAYRNIYTCFIWYVR